MSKKQLRQEMLRQLQVFSQNALIKKQTDQHLLKAFIATEAYKNAKTIATYLALPWEVDTSLLIQKALSDHKQVLVPKTFSKGMMQFITYDADRLQKTAFGLLEPISDLAIAKSTIDVIHVPGLLFDKEGYRIGYGAGFYDRYLNNYTGETISTVYPFQIQTFPKDNHDIPVRKLIV